MRGKNVFFFALETPTHEKVCIIVPRTLHGLHFNTDVYKLMLEHRTIEMSK